MVSQDIQQITQVPAVSSASFQSGHFKASRLQLFAPAAGIYPHGGLQANVFKKKFPDHNMAQELYTIKVCFLRSC